MEYARKMYARDPQLKGFDLIGRGLYAGREDGIASALGYMLAVPDVARDDGVVDIMICNGLGRVNAEDFAYGLSLASRLVKPEGHLLLGSPIEKIGGGLSFSEQLEIVSDKFRIVKQRTERTGNPALGISATSTFAILKRKG